ncbi:TonB-dependent receptor [Olivibacter ginsenosidimutans]|uniref:TonB-dependent receptor n=1 Tax=Olivibacter ginsenosidimutans TaxID=1176537 RepID=A0ABP9BNR1_9SPHI
MFSWAQSNQLSVTGIVYNEVKEPLVSASIHFPALNKTTVTDANGHFELALPPGTFSIKISELGYVPLETSILVSQQNKQFTFTLKTDTAMLEGATVFGYSQTHEINRQAYHVSAVDAQKLHNSTLDIAHVLDRVPGARLRETGGVGSDVDFSISGFSGKRVKFFLDGVPMDYFGPSFQINAIPINFAERVEVYKGVIPVWLGSDALGGAVNIVTGNKLKNFLDVSYAYGSFNTHRSYINGAFTSKNGFTFRLNAFQNYSDNDYNVTVDAADIHTGAYYPNTTVRRFHDKYHNETGIVQVGFVDKKWADQLLAGITLGQYYKEIQTGARIIAVFGAWHTRGNIVMPTLKYQKKDLFTKGLDVAFNANYNFGEEQNIDTVHARYGWLGDSVTLRGKGGENWYSWYKYRNNVASTSATATYKIGNKHFFALNHVYTHFDRKGTNAVDPDDVLNRIPQQTNKHVVGLSYQYAVSEKWSATIFGKYLRQNGHTTLVETDFSRPLDTVYNDAYVDLNKFGYGFATTYFIDPDLQLKFSYEKTNRLPEAEDWFGDVMNKDGNWNLKPESSNNFNLGASYTIPFGDHRLYTSATGIYYYAQDFIYYSPLSSNPNKLYPDNLFDVSSMGVESEVRYSYKRLLTAGISLTYQNIRDQQKYRIDLPNVLSSTYKNRIPNIPYSYGNADVTLYLNNVLQDADKLSVGYNLLYVHDFYLYWESEGKKDTKRTIPTQIAHDANMVYTFKNGRYNIALECKNLTDSKLYDNFSLQKPGRSFTMKLRYFLSN